ncbi:MAG TPA: hypothetical protein PKD51_00200 [Saprospiraceae bacterium]|nr:hypothetical protein [Saprospiraceae bacterium]HMU02875.1 hypothetical protein [Saprospiraceae bacterium]
MNFNNTFTLAFLFSILLLTSCNKDENKPIFDNCVMPYGVGDAIDQNHLNSEIVRQSFEIFPQADTLVAIVFDFCTYGKRLVVQLEGENFHSNLLYDSCGDLLSKDLLSEPDSALKLTFENHIKKEFGTDAELYDLYIFNYISGVTEYNAEVVKNGSFSSYLLDNNGKVLCKIY